MFYRRLVSPGLVCDLAVVERLLATQDETMSAPTRLRKTVSFVKREGRTTKAQQRALTDLLPQRLLLPAVLENENRLPLREPNQQVMLEIGFGNGDALVHFAGLHPQWLCIGAEVYRPGIGAALLSARERDIENLWIYEGDALELLRDTIPVTSLDRVHLFFPDPWPKKRHHKRRIVQPELIRLLAQKIKTGGQLMMATDWQPYAEHMLEVLSASDTFDNAAAGGGYAERYAQRPQTRFEQRGGRLGHGVWDLQFLRNTSS